MDREKVIELLKVEQALGTLPVETILECIASYCREFGKEEDDIKLLLAALPRYRVLCIPYYQQALDFFKKKHHICILYSRPDTSGSRSMIQIF